MKNVVIFSVFQSELDKQTNLNNTRKIVSLFKKSGMNFKIAQGCYKGISEISFIVPICNHSSIVKLAKQYNQESILLVDSIGNAKLSYVESYIKQSIGKMFEVSQNRALSEVSYTKVENKYFICK
jgi:hypothetical protein